LHDTYRLERTQNRAARLITGTPFRTSTDKLRRDLGMTTLTTRRQLHKLSMYHKHKHDSRIPEYISSTLPNTRQRDTGRMLRNSSFHTLPSNRTTSYQHSFIPSTTRQWNNLPQATRSPARYSQFKKTVIQHLGTSRPLKFYYFGSKLGNNLHTKLRLNISDLKSHQFRIQKADSTACTCGHNQENTAHFVLSCPLYTHLRNYLYRSISLILNIDLVTFPSSVKLDILLHGKELNTDDGGKVASSFQNFLIKTKRFC